MDGTKDILRIGDDGFLAACFQEIDDSLDLRSHGTLLEVNTIFHVFLCFIKRHVIQPLLIRVAIVNSHLFDCG